MPITVEDLNDRMSHRHAFEHFAFEYDKAIGKYTGQDLDGIGVGMGGTDWIPAFGRIGA